MSFLGIYIHRVLIRITSITVVVCFLLADVAGAAPVATTIVQPIIAQQTLNDVIQNPSKIQIPFNYCSIKDYHQGNNGKLIIHIQDAHANFSGQKNLARTMDSMMTSYGIETVLVEGGVGDVTLDGLKEIAEQKTWGILANKFLFEGLITGAEYLNLTSENSLKLMGIERNHLYQSNLVAYAQLAKHRDDVFKYLHRINISISRLKNRLYPKEILDFEQHQTASAKEGGDFLATFDDLMKLVQSTPIDLPRDFIEVNQLKLLKIREKSIPFDEVSREQAGLLRTITNLGEKAWVENYIEGSKKSQHSQMAQTALLNNLFDIATSKGVVMAEYPNLLEYQAYLRAFSSLSIDSLLSEWESLQDAVYRYWLEDDDVKKIRAIDRYVGLLKKASQIQMSSHEFKLLEANEPIFKTQEWQNFLNTKLKQFDYKDGLIEYKPYLESAFKDLKSFYSLVAERDGGFVQITQNILESQDAKAAFLIAGGYHTEHLTQLLKDQGYSYVVLTPIVEQETNMQKYEDILLQPLKLMKNYDMDNANSTEQLPDQSTLNQLALASRFATDRTDRMQKLADPYNIGPTLAAALARIQENTREPLKPASDQGLGISNGSRMVAHIDDRVVAPRDEVVLNGADLGKVLEFGLDDYRFELRVSEGHVYFRRIGSESPPQIFSTRQSPTYKKRGIAVKLKSGSDGSITLINTGNAPIQFSSFRRRPGYGEFAVDQLLPSNMREAFEGINSGLGYNSFEVISTNADLQDFGSEFRQKLQTIDGDPFVAIQMVEVVNENESKNPRYDYKVIIDRKERLKGDLGKIWAGNLLVSEYEFEFSLSYYPVKNALHLHDISLGRAYAKELNKRGFASEFFDNTAREINRVFPDAFISTTALDRGFVLKKMRDYFGAKPAAIDRLTFVTSYTDVDPPHYRDVLVGRVPIGVRMTSDDEGFVIDFDSEYQMPDVILAAIMGSDDEGEEYKSLFARYITTIEASDRRSDAIYKDNFFADMVKGIAVLANKYPRAQELLSAVLRAEINNRSKYLMIETLLPEDERIVSAADDAVRTDLINTYTSLSEFFLGESRTPSTSYYGTYILRALADYDLKIIIPFLDKIIVVAKHENNEIEEGVYKAIFLLALIAAKAEDSQITKQANDELDTLLSRNDNYSETVHDARDLYSQSRMTRLNSDSDEASRLTKKVNVADFQEQLRRLGEELTKQIGTKVDVVLSGSLWNKVDSSGHTNLDDVGDIDILAVVNSSPLETDQQENLNKSLIQGLEIIFSSQDLKLFDLAQLYSQVSEEDRYVMSTNPDVKSPIDEPTSLKAVEVVTVFTRVPSDDYIAVLKLRELLNFARSAKSFINSRQHAYSSDLKHIKRYLEVESRLYDLLPNDPSGTREVIERELSLSEPIALSSLTDLLATSSRLQQIVDYFKPMEEDVWHIQALNFFSGNAELDDYQLIISDEFSLKLVNTFKAQRQNKAKRLQLSLVETNSTFLPSFASISELARRAGVVVFYGQDKIAEFMEGGFNKYFTLPGPKDGGSALAFTKYNLDRYAQDKGVTTEEFVKSLDLDPKTQGIIFLPHSPKGYYVERVFLEEIFHHLDGNFAGVSGWGGSELRDFMDILEIVNDLMILLFYPEQEIGGYDQHYIEQDIDIRLALVRRYRDELGLDPNTQMDRVIAQLLEDSKSGEAVIKVDGRQLTLAQAFFGNLLDSEPQNESKLIKYLEVLTQSQRYAEFSPLFPDWELESPSPSDALSDDSNVPSDISDASGSVGSLNLLKRFGVRFYDWIARTVSGHVSRAPSALVGQQSDLSIPSKFASLTGGGVFVERDAEGPELFAQKFARLLERVGESHESYEFILAWSPQMVRIKQALPRFEERLKSIIQRLSNSHIQLEFSDPLNSLEDIVSMPNKPSEHGGVTRKTISFLTKSEIDQVDEADLIPQLHEKGILASEDEGVDLILAILAMIELQISRRDARTPLTDVLYGRVDSSVIREVQTFSGRIKLIREHLAGVLGTVNFGEAVLSLLETETKA